jgi:hypothetical protein
LSSLTITAMGDEYICKCRKAVCLPQQTISELATHVEMEPDRMGDHTNLKGTALFQVTFDEKGHLVSAKAVSGNPIAVHLLISAAKRWRFKPYMQDGVTRRACGWLEIKFTMIENIPSAKVVIPDNH